MIQRWEYKSIMISIQQRFGDRPDPYKIDKELAPYGNEAWELVTALPTNERVNEVICILKRPKVIISNETKMGTISTSTVQESERRGRLFSPR